MATITLSTIKDIFFLIGSIAGIVSIIKPVYETKFESDKKKMIEILELIPEKDIISLSDEIWHSHRASDRILENFSRLEYQVEERLNQVSFYGPLADYIKTELENVAHHYSELRKFIQVPYWIPRSLEHWSGWEIDKSGFFDHGEDYVKNLEQAHDNTKLIRNSIRRLQILCDVHFVESFFPRLSFSKRLKSVSLDSASCHESQSN